MSKAWNRLRVTIILVTANADDSFNFSRSAQDRCTYSSNRFAHLPSNLVLTVQRLAKIMHNVLWESCSQNFVPMYLYFRRYRKCCRAIAKTLRLLRKHYGPVVDTRSNSNCGFTQAVGFRNFLWEDWFSWMNVLPLCLRGESGYILGPNL